MKIFFLFLLYLPLSLSGQSKIKKVLVEGNGAPVLMLSGGTADMHVFNTHSQLLSRSYRVIRMEQFNIQYADEGRLLPKNYSVAMESEALKYTMDSLGEKKPVILIGHSYGGLIALDFAINHPGKVRSLILIEPPVFGMADLKSESPEGMNEMREISKKFTPLSVITEKMVMEFRCELMNCDSFDITHHPMWQTWIKQKDRLRGLSAVSNYHLNLNKLYKFNKPVLLITGIETVPFHKRINELLAGVFPHAEIVTLPGGHTAINSNPNDFVACFEKFLNKR